MKDYYDTRAPEYDDWYESRGQFAAEQRPQWDEAVRTLIRTLAQLPPAKTLDVACGTGFLTRHLPGEVTGLDQSERMLDVARRQSPSTTFVRGDALTLPFADQAFERIFTGHFYGHLEGEQRSTFVTEALRVARELVVADSAARPDRARDGWQARRLNNGSCFQVYKRYFRGVELADELGGGEILHESPWFVVVAVSRG